MASDPWRRCDRCANFCETETKGAFECRLNPPIVFGETFAQSLFPNVKPDDWCGQGEFLVLAEDEDKNKE